MFLDLSNIVVKSNNEPLPAGKYQAKVIEAAVQQTKSGKGKYIKMKLVITSGDHEGKSVYNNFNIENESARAKEIGLENLKRFVEVADMNPVVESVKDFIGKKVTVATKLVENNKGSMMAEVHYFDRAEKQSDGIL